MVGKPVAAAAPSAVFRKLRREAVGECVRFFNVARDEADSLRGDCGLCNLIALRLALYFQRDLFGELRLAGDEDCQRFRIVLGLRY